MTKFLDGKIIKEIKIAKDDGALLFICEDGNHVARADGDCCSLTWVENVSLPLSFPCTVLGADDVDMPDPTEGQEDDEDSYGVIAYYGLKIRTDRGDILIDYRNSSNGYYGGNLRWPDDDYFYGGVRGQNISEEDWVDIKDD